MALPTIGDGEYLGAGNQNETLNLGYAAQAVQLGGAAAAVTVGSGAGAVQVGGALGAVTIGSGAANVTVGGATTLVGFYGRTPVVIRPYTAAVHATSAQASSSDFGATQLATLQEIMKTLIGLGIWATV